MSPNRRRRAAAAFLASSSICLLAARLSPAAGPAPASASAPASPSAPTSAIPPASAAPALAATVAASAATIDRGEQLDRGRYLVHQVAMCVQCHSPRDAGGQIIESRLLNGAPMPVRSPFAAQDWALKAPAIAGLPGWLDEDFVTLMTTGRRPTGERPRAPMPPYRLSAGDAAAIAVYLRSLR